LKKFGVKINRLIHYRVNVILIIIVCLLIEISRSLNCKQNKKEINRIERQLDKLKLIAKETDEISVQIKQLEGLIKNYYPNTLLLKALLHKI
jgi:hypothetical protein